MRKNKEPSKYKTGARKGRVINGYHQIGDVSVDSGQIAIADPCNMGEEPDTIVSTNFGDGVFPIYEHWEDNKRVALVIPLDTDVHLMLNQVSYIPTQDPPSYKKDNLKPGEFNPKDIGSDGYKYIEDMNEDYK